MCSSDLSPITTAGTLTLGGTLATANGGTGGTATPTAGAVAYGTGTAYAFTVAGTSGQVLTSTGAGAPTWSTPSTGSFQPAYYGTFVSSINQTNGGATAANATVFDQAAVDTAPVLISRASAMPPLASRPPFGAELVVEFVVDAQGQTTRVALYEPQVGMALDPQLFVFLDPKIFGEQGTR